MSIGIYIAIIVIIGAVVAAYFLFFKKNASSTSGTTSGTVVSSGWSIIDSVGMPAQMTQASDGTYFFDFPPRDGVHYIVKPSEGLQLGQLVSMTFSVSGNGNAVPVQGNPPAKVSLFMQRQGDDLSAAGVYQQYRYWHSSADLISGDGTLSATLTPDQWTDVFGKPGTDFPSQFADCVANAAYIGMTFGDPSAGAAGHGAYTTSDNRFTLKSFTVG